MANTPVEFFAPSGLALTLKLYAQGMANVEAGSFVATEKTIAKGYYVATVTTPLIGAYNARVTLADDTTIAGFAIDLLDSLDVHRPAQENPPTRSNVRQWLSSSVTSRTVNQFIWNGSGWILTQPTLPHVSANVAHFAGYPSDNFIHSGGENPELHSHVHGFSTEALEEIAGVSGGETSAQLEADVFIDYSVSPALVIWYEKGTTTEIMRKQAYDRNGAPITSKLQQLGRLVHVDSP